MIEDIKKTLWATADKLRANMDAAEYKHIVLGLIFVKYISDTFQTRRAELTRKFADSQDDYYLDDADPDLINAELEDRDYYKEVNVFWVPEAARWETLRAQAKQADIGKRIDDALSLIETENPKLKGILDKRYARVQLPDGKLGELVDLVSKIGFGESCNVEDRNKNHARDLLGQVYEYCLGQFANAEGKRGGQFYTPASIVKLLVAILNPHQGQVYDSCCGSGGMFVQSEKFIEAHGGKLGDVSIYGQEANPTTWRLAAMNLAIRGIDFNLGKEPADSFLRDQHPDLRADYVMANPPFNISDWWHGSLEGDPRWVYGTPPQGNANYAWLQHILYHLKPTGRAGIVLANGSMSSSQNSEGEIRRAMVEADKVEVMVALPGQLFFNTQIPACLWFLVKEKRVRKGEVLFIDARKLGSMISRVQCEFTDDIIEQIANTVAAWRGESASSEDYADIPGYCRSVTLAEIAEHGHVLTPGRYVGAEAVEDDDESFADSFEGSELGLVPRGWQYSTVGESFILTMGQSPPGDTYNGSGEGLAFYQGKTDFGFRFPSQRMFCTAPTRLAKAGDTLVSVRAPVGDVNMALERCCLGRGVAGVRHPDGFRSFAFYSVKGLRAYFDLFDSEGTVFGSINKKDFLGLPIVQPSTAVLAAFEEIATPIDQKIIENEEQIRTLSTLRETLLPRLISGQLRLPETETLLKETQ